MGKWNRRRSRAGGWPAVAYGGIRWWRSSCELGRFLAGGSSFFLCVFCISCSPWFCSPASLFLLLFLMVMVLLLTVARGGGVADYRRWHCGGSSGEWDGCAQGAFCQPVILSLLLCVHSSYILSLLICLFLSSPSFFLYIVLSKCCCISVFKTIFPFCFFFLLSLSLFYSLPSLFVHPPFQNCPLLFGLFCLVFISRRRGSHPTLSSHGDRVRWLVLLPIFGFPQNKIKMKMRKYKKIFEKNQKIIEVRKGCWNAEKKTEIGWGDLKIQELKF